MKKLFLGSGLHFPFKINKDGNVALVSNEDDIQEAIKIVLQTAPGERVMRPDFGCGINNYVFSIINTANLLQIENEIQRALTLYEPRILIQKVKASSAQSDNGYLDVSIEYLVKSSNARQNIVYPFYIREKG
ncbi:MAG: baseplate protein [Epsilonproteobacteria bacterium]|nr:MAG: baseplate protein [Campylobacterota bacterium]